MNTNQVRPPRLVADIGGTHATFALVEASGGPRRAETLRTAEFPDLAEAVRCYLAKVGDAVPQEAAFAVACPIDGDLVTMTNCPWRFSRRRLATELRLRRLDVLNDFEALAMALPALGHDALVPLGGDAAELRACKVVLGPGTGLGVAALIPSASGWIALPGEGGHVTVAATNDREAAVIALLRERFGHVSAERVLSGPGLANLHGALAALSGVVQAPAAPERITEAGLAEPGLARDALTLFCAFLGSFAGNAALTFGARGGLFIAGGVARRLSRFLADSPFRERFEAKGRFSAFLAPIPAALIVRPNAALDGCAEVLRTGGCPSPTNGPADA